MSIHTAEANAVLIAVSCDHCCMKTVFIKAILSVSNKPSISCYNFTVQRLSLLTLFLFTHASVLSKFSSHCHNVILHTFDFPLAFPWPFLSFSPSVFLYGTFQMVTHTATVAVQSPTSPTWLAPSCWISSLTSKGVGEVEGTVVQAY